MKAATLPILLLAPLAGAQTFHFDSAAAGSMPTGWTSAMTHRGGAPQWELRRDDSAPSKSNVFAQVSTDRTSGRFPLAVYDGASVKDGTIGVRFKTISGQTDQAAGLIWRYRDPDNYYVVRANALEDNVVLYKVEKGERIALAPRNTPSSTYGVKHAVPKQTWNDLTVTFQGNLFTVGMGGKQLFQVEDSTFGNAGKVGLWTKADSVTQFDDFTIQQK